MPFVSFQRAMRSPKFQSQLKTGAVRSIGQRLKQAIKEARGTKTWARFKPGATATVRNLQVHVGEGAKVKGRLT